MDKQYTEEDRCDTCQRITFEYLISIFTDTPNADQPETIFEYPDIETTRKTCSLCDTICLGRRRNRNTGPLLEIPCPAKLYLFPGYWNERGYEPSTDQFDCIWVVLYDNNTLGSSWNGMPSLSRCVSQLKLSVDDGSFASRWIPDPPVPPKRSRQTFRQIARWFEACESAHDICKNGLSGDAIGYETTLPTRLLHISSPSHLRLVRTNGKEGRYTTLSHCWGRRMPIRTTKENIEEHERGILYERLPPTFKDAIEVTKSLGLAYLWIDSLCIIQDDPEDWLREAKEMDGIYERSSLTIAASSARDSHGGLFDAGRMPRYIGLSSHCHAKERDDIYLSPYPEWADIALDREPLNLRAWVFQGRRLSRRVLHFASSQVYWECQGWIQSQSCTKPEYELWPISFPFRANESEAQRVQKPPQQHSGKSTKIKAERCQTRNAKHHTGVNHLRWNEILSYYSTKRLTKTDDRVVALEGIKERLKVRFGTECIAGHWVDSPKCFIRSLVWLVVVYVQALPQGMIQPRAPTWSVLAFEHWIWYALLHVTHVDWSICALDDFGIKMLSRPFVPHRQARGGPSARVSGLLVTGYKLSPSADFPPEHWFQYKYSFKRGECLPPGGTQDFYELPPGAIMAEANVFKTDLDSPPMGWVMFDSLENQPSSFYCCPVEPDFSNLYCLVLQRCEDDALVFRRIGLVMIFLRTSHPPSRPPTEPDEIINHDVLTS